MFITSHPHSTFHRLFQDFLTFASESFLLGLVMKISTLDTSYTVFENEQNKVLLVTVQNFHHVLS